MQVLQENFLLIELKQTYQTLLKGREVEVEKSLNYEGFDNVRKTVIIVKYVKFITFE